MGFITNVFVLITDSLPIALFVSYFLITLPTWVFVLVVASMAIKLLNFVFVTNEIQKFLSSQQKQTEQLEESKELEEKANNHAKFYLYGNKYYKNRPTTLIGDFFRHIGDIYFSGFFGKQFMSQGEIKRKYRLMFVRRNILTIIFNLCLWSLIVSCFLITVPKWLFVLAIAVATSKFIGTFCRAHLARQTLRREIFFLKCQNGDEDGWYAANFQAIEEIRYDGVPECPECDVINENSMLCMGGMIPKCEIIDEKNLDMD